MSKIVFSLFVSNNRVYYSLPNEHTMVTSLKQAHRFLDRNQAICTKTAGGNRCITGVYEIHEPAEQQLEDYPKPISL